MQKLILGCLLMAVLLSGCGNEGKEEESDQFPHNLVHEDFSYTSFDYPADWEVTAVSSNVRLSYRDEDNPEDNEYASVPYRYTFSFGERAPENDITEEDLEDYNEENALNEESMRQNYYHTSFENYGQLDISKNGFLRLLTDYENTEHWEVSGEEVLVLRDENQWIANWFSERNYYDLLVTNEAMIGSEQEFEGLLEMMIQ
ncbi:hypothetical protein [Salisediminibacterium beveridgei]|uniref:DUF4367 domain-containing protein n=1 Tax=Salisediminibacterium beveridgei TaxID=632773 RepID=A0A1D7QYS8_9BACI|nr:hypothetical protein [Salisediminibacterium beveridgei]AOM84157.1 hypothetical protein BBEV_2832 [Salisediminibacterium beveridgei]